ncbi:hypothetical protein K443DRAFT_674410 [Laccaria amethystina LaAM-08-1]|uniref:Uncharacterized protein n=1 Tax=Laccaria amethystina LaAM-08-1 TaxID=1095629 RepID=A0A0C9XXT8_9AGAR|nr:hypothetical protein K443DRAFT_674410 [Laccaria amethystina LaAM-08-1]
MSGLYLKLRQGIRLPNPESYSFKLNGHTYDPLISRRRPLLISNFSTCKGRDAAFHDAHRYP